MKNKGLLFKILACAFACISLFTYFLPILASSEFFGSSYKITAAKIFGMDELEELVGYASSGINYITLIKVILVILIILNIVSAISVWWPKVKMQCLAGVLNGFIQTGLWGFFLVYVWIVKNNSEYGLEFVHVGVGTYLFIICGLGLIIFNVLLIMHQESSDAEETSIGRLIGLTGEYAGAKIPIGKEPIVIGRDQHCSNIILQNNQVSRQHCSIVYDANRKLYIVRDFSSNGTFLENGTRLNPNQVNELPAGTQFRVGTNKFMLQ